MEEQNIPVVDITDVLSVSPEEVVSFTLEDVLVPGIGIVVDAVVSIDYNSEDAAREIDVIPIGAFTREFLNNSTDPEFIQVVSANLAEALVSDADLGLNPLIDSITVDLQAESSVVPFPFTSETTRTAENGEDQVVGFTIEDVLVPGIGIVTDATVSLDYNNLEDAVSTDVIPVGAFVEEFLSNSTDPDFIQVVSNNLAEALLEESSFGFASSLDSLTVELAAAPGVVPFAFTSTSVFNSDGEADEVVSFSLQDVLVPGIGIVVDATVTIDYTDLEAAEQQDVIPIGGFVREFLNDSTDPDFIQVVNNDLGAALLDFEDLGSLVDDIEIELEAESSIVPFPFTSNVTIDGTGATEQTVSFVLEDVLIPGIGIVVDANVNLDYINSEAATTDVIPIGAFVEDFLSNVTEPEFVQVVADNLSQAVFNDESLGLTSLLDSVSVDLEAAPGVVPFPFTASFTEVGTSEVITYDLSWEGDDGYSLQGLFSYDGDFEGSIVTEDELTGMQLAFFEPDGTLLQVFDYDLPTDAAGEFNFSFDTVTETVLQIGESDSDTGFDLGVDFSAGESGIGFFSGEDDSPGFPSGGTIALTRDNPPLASDLLDQGGELIASLA